MGYTIIFQIQKFTFAMFINFNVYYLNMIYLACFKRYCIVLFCQLVSCIHSNYLIYMTLFQHPFINSGSNKEVLLGVHPENINI